MSFSKEISPSPPNHPYAFIAGNCRRIASAISGG
jgi:hypothetical protein